MAKLQFVISKASKNFKNLLLKIALIQYFVALFQNVRINIVTKLCGQQKISLYELLLAYMKTYYASVELCCL